MSVKKLLILGAASLAAVSTTAAMAGSHYNANQSASSHQHHVYVDGQLGYVTANWKNFSQSFLSVDQRKNDDGGFTGGVDVGYTLTPHIAIEAGWMYLPQIHGVAIEQLIPFLPSRSTPGKMDSWFAYTAAKFTVPTLLMKHLDIFGKVGAAYRYQDFSPGQSGDGAWTPLFGAGLQYGMGCWEMGVQYLHLQANTSVSRDLRRAGLFSSNDAAPAANLYTAFVGYSFAV